MRTARSRTSGENFGDLFIAPSSQVLEPPQNPGRFIVDDRLRALMDDGKLKRVLRGVYVPVEVHPPARCISKTVLTDGTVKIEIGDEVLTLTPREDRALAMLQVGAVMQVLGIATSKAIL